MEPAREFLLVTPSSELNFYGPYDRATTTNLRLYNPTNKKFLYKIKSTTPTFYIVRNYFGELLPNETTDIEIILKTTDPNMLQANKHKFLVESLIVNEDAKDLQVLWNKATPDDLLNTKLTVNFITNPGGSSETSDYVDNTSSTADDHLKVSPEHELKVLRGEVRDLRKQNKRLLTENRSLKALLRKTSQKLRCAKKNRDTSLFLCMGAAVMFGVFFYWIYPFAMQVHETGIIKTTTEVKSN